ncbi:DUF4396 domain-containing protein [Streptomyces sp. ISL-100]|nr:DUF4396 domain-containing protein [Streptomyces sp. ISL-100]
MGAGGASWGTAARATAHCLTGCAIGEIPGMAIGTALLWGNVPTMVLAIALAFLFAYSFTMYAVHKAGLGLEAAIRVDLAADALPRRDITNPCGRCHVTVRQWYRAAWDLTTSSSTRAFFAVE